MIFSKKSLLEWIEKMFVHIRSSFPPMLPAIHPTFPCLFTSMISAYDPFWKKGKRMFWQGCILDDVTWLPRRVCTTSLSKENCYPFDAGAVSVHTHRHNEHEIVAVQSLNDNRYFQGKKRNFHHLRTQHTRSQEHHLSQDCVRGFFFISTKLFLVTGEIYFEGTWGPSNGPLPSKAFPRKFCNSENTSWKKSVRRSFLK